MTREEAIAIFKDWLDEGVEYDDGYATRNLYEDEEQAVIMAIKALEQEPQCTEHPCLGTLCRYYKEPCDDCIFEEGSKYCIEHCPHEAKANKPCDDAVSREAVDKYIVELLSGYLYDEERERLEKLNVYLWELPSVTQKSETVTEFADRCRECGARYGKYRKEAKRWKNKWLKSQKSGKWIDYRDDGFVECPFCGHATNCEDDIDELHYCFYCGARMVEPQESEDKE